MFIKGTENTPDYSLSDFWDFGTSGQYPALKVDFDGDGTATWQEFGNQRGDVPGPIPAPMVDNCVEIMTTAFISGAWSSDCASGRRPASYARLHLHLGRFVEGDNRPGIRRHRYLPLPVARPGKDRRGTGQPRLRQQKLQDRAYVGRRDLHRRGSHLRRRTDRQLHADRQRAGNSSSTANAIRLRLSQQRLCRQHQRLPSCRHQRLRRLNPRTPPNQPQLRRRNPRRPQTPAAARATPRLRIRRPVLQPSACSCWRLRWL